LQRVGRTLVQPTRRGQLQQLLPDCAKAAQTAGSADAEAAAVRIDERTEIGQPAEFAGAEAGGKVVLARAGKPVVQLVRLRKRRGGIKLGLLKGRLPERLLADIDKPLTRHEVDELFGGALQP